MQEEVENRTLTLVVSGTKFTGRLLKAAISKYMAHCKEKKLQKQRSRDAPVTPHGKQTVKQLIGQNSEKDILKLVTTLIANTKGEGKAGDDFWVKAETLLYCALIGYIHYEAPVEEQNFSTLIEFINAMEVREDDEEFKNPVDLMFDALEAEKPNHFAVRQYKKYKLAAGDICSK